MAYQSVHEDINWQNLPSTNTPLGASNLSKVNRELGIYDLALLNLDINKLTAEDIAQAVKSVVVNTTTGVITITHWDNTTESYDLNIEKVVTNFTYDPDSQCLVLTLADGTTIPIDLSAFIKETEFTSSSTIAFSTVNHNVTASVKAHSITANELQTDYLAEITSEKSQAVTAKNQSQTQALISEGWAVGAQNGVDVGDDSPYKDNNSKYYAEYCDEVKDYIDSRNLNFNWSINPQTGHLIYEDVLGYTFSIDTNGHMNVTAYVPS